MAKNSLIQITGLNDCYNEFNFVKEGVDVEIKGVKGKVSRVKRKVFLGPIEISIQRPILQGGEKYLGFEIYSINKEGIVLTQDQKSIVCTNAQQKNIRQI